jgi:hypothetical protein
VTVTTLAERTRRSWPAAAATVVVTVAVLGPMYVAGGIALRGDMVFTPDQPWKRAWLGLDGSVPRAVPMDALVSLADEVLPGAVLQRLLLTAAFILGGLGVARLAGRFHSFGQVAAVVVYLWSPWVHERLAIGQWVTVLAYGLLPWLVLAAARAREGRPAGWPATALLLVLIGACAPSMGLLGALVGLAVVATGKEPRRILGLLGLAAVANLPWIVPAALGPGLEATTSQFGDFAARAESGLGTVASLLSMGGIWKASIVPPERTHVVVVAVAVLMSAAFLLGFRYAVPVLGRRTAAGLVAAGGASLLLALLPAIGPVGRSLGSMSAHWPALGVLRDSQRYLAPFGLLLAMGAAALVDRQLVRARSGQAGAGALAGLVVLAPVLLLPSLVWGLAGGLRPVSYPADWARVAAEVSGTDGATVVLPWTGSYRGYAWNDHRAVLDPAARFLPGDVLVDDRILLRHGVVQGEDPFLVRIGAALRDSDPAQALRELGVRWVLVEKGNGVGEADVPVGVAAFDGRWLRLVDLGAPIHDLGPLRPAPRAAIVMSGDIAAVLVGCVSVLQLGRRLVRTRQ